MEPVNKFDSILFLAGGYAIVTFILAAVQVLS